MQVSHYLSRIGVFGIIVRGRTDKKDRAGKSRRFFGVLFQTEDKKKDGL